MHSKRRAVLGAGAGVMVAGTAALTWRAWDQGVFSSGQGPAYAAWNEWNAAAEGSERHLVHAAILAASPHNTQPWRFRVERGRIDVLADPARNIGTIDPFRREQHIGLGCALENLLLAASATGRSARVLMLPDRSAPDLIARVELESGASAVSPLYAAIPHRRTNRGAYQPRELPGADFDAMQALSTDLPAVSVRWIRDAAGKAELGAHIVAATQAIVADAEQSRDSAAWFRKSWQDVQGKRDGLTLDAQALPLWMRVAAKVLPPIPDARADRIWIDATRDVQVPTAAAFGVILARDASDVAQRVTTGRLWQRMHLWATAHGIAMQPLNQIVERADRERSLGGATRFGEVLRGVAKDDAWQVLMPFRLGYPAVDVLASPRRSVDEVLVA